MDRDILKDVKRLVVKIGSSTITDSRGGIAKDFLATLCETVHRLNERGIAVTVVSSGAIALGYRLLQLELPLPDIPTKQASAAAGQPLLMSHYIREFKKIGLPAAQILITREDFQDRRRYLNARESLLKLLHLGCVPIVNENDTVLVDEIKFGDNDNLSALVTGLIDADLLVLLTDVEAVYDADPHRCSEAHALSHITEITQELLDQAGEGGALGRGGMHSKLLAAKTTADFGIATMIAKGDRHTLNELVAGKSCGTWIDAAENRMISRKRWISRSLEPEGGVIVDRGAYRALCERGKSLLPSGVIGIVGQFERGALVEIKDRDGHAIGRGLSRYSSLDVPRIAGCHSKQIRSILGYTFGEEIVHRDDMVIDRNGDVQ